MDKFTKMSHPGVCDVCGSRTNVVVCSSAFGPISHAYCRHCLSNYLEPYGTMVSYISCAGEFPDDINEVYQNLCRRILKELDIPEEKFIKDVKDAIAEYDAYEEAMSHRNYGVDEFPFE